MSASLYFISGVVCLLIFLLLNKKQKNTDDSTTTQEVESDEVYELTNSYEIPPTPTPIAVKKKRGRKPKNP